MNSCPFGRTCEKGKFLDKFYGDKEKPCSTVYPTCHIYRELKDAANKAKDAKKNPPIGQPVEAPAASEGFFAHFKKTG